MAEQTNAQRLADALLKNDHECLEAAAELRRLEAVNAQLLEALDDLARYADTCELFLKETHPGKAASLRGRVAKARAAIAAAKGEK